MRVEMKAGMQRKVNKYGSVLKAYRAEGRRGDLFLLLLGIYFIFFGVLLLLGVLCEAEEAIVLLIASAVLGGSGVVMLFIRIIMRVSRMRNYLSYYQRQTGYSVEELQEADRELMGSSAVAISGMIYYYARKPVLIYIITEHYFFSVGYMKGSYLWKLEDIVAAFYSCQIPQKGVVKQREGLFIISRQDINQKPFKNHITKKWYRGFETLMWVENCDKFCAEILEEIRKRAPHIIPFQNIVVNGIQYNLISMENWQEDWRRIQYGQ